jgi:nitrile hydratase accessory protein
MNLQDKDDLKPLASVDGAAAFDEPWQAEALAIADTLVRDGMFSAGSWSQALGEALRQAEAGGASDDQQTYYQCVLTALEGLIAQHSEIDRPAMTAKREDWEKAYLSTPHGQPVKLEAQKTTDIDS